MQPAYKTDKVERMMGAWNGDSAFSNNRKTYYTCVLVLVPGVVLGRVRCASHARVQVMGRHRVASVCCGGFEQNALVWTRSLAVGNV